MLASFRNAARKITSTASLAFVAFSGGNIAQAQQQMQRNDRCAPISEPASLKGTAPAIAWNLGMMTRLPITGDQLLRRLFDPANRMIACDANDLPSNYAGAYGNRVLKMSTTAGTNATFHEAWHALQDIMGIGVRQVAVLTEKDAYFVLMMAEATAIAYEMAAEKEALNKGIKFKKDGISYQSNIPQNISIFSDAYNAAFQENHRDAPDVREAKALSAAGKAIVRRLMNGTRADWSLTYLLQNQGLMKTEVGPIPDDGRERRGNYSALRKSMISKTGNIVGLLAFVPDEYLGPEADRYIEMSLNRTFDAAQALAQKLKNHQDLQKKRRP